MIDGSFLSRGFSNSPPFMLSARWVVVYVIALMSSPSFGCGSNADKGTTTNAVVQTSGVASSAGSVATSGAVQSGGGDNVVATGGANGGGADGTNSGETGGTSGGETGGANDATGGTNGGGTGGTPPVMGNTDCMITSTLTMSAIISTVGVVEWSTDLSGIESAYIDFGLDQNYGMQAPVDLTEANYRTLLLGMKPDHSYHYRIVAMAGSQTCTGPDNTLMTGSMPTDLGLVDMMVDTLQPDKVAKGFLLAGFGGTGQSGPTFILDADGDYVWWFDSGEAMRVHMSYDAKYMWTQAVNWSLTSFGGGGGSSPGGNPVIHRVNMDGTEMQTYGLNDIGDATHDFDVTPDGGYISPQFDSAGCMTIREHSADGQNHDIIASNTVNPQSVVQCLVNSIHYWPSDDSITYSDLPHNSYVKISHAGEVQWVLGGDNSTFTQGDAISWHGEHGHHLFAPDRFLMFNNGVNAFGGPSDGPSSIVYEIQLDQATNTATRVWQYDAGLQTTVFGDVQRLPNGNTVVNYGTQNTIHEVDSDAKLVRSITWPSGDPVPYIEWRHSLYGPPDR